MKETIQEHKKDICFSIVIPSYKGYYLKDAIDSCLNQTYNNFEIIIVDDASPENLKGIVDHYKDSRLSYYRNKKNIGAYNLVDNWNVCLSYCKGDFVICMGDDDKLLPHCLNEYLKLMQKYPGLSVYHAWTEIIDDNNNFINLQQPRPEYEGAMSLMWNRWNGRNRQYIGDFCFEINRLRSQGGFYKFPLAWCSDDVTAVIAATDLGIANTQIVCFQYRENCFSISSSDNAEYKIEALNKEKEWSKCFLDRTDPKSAIESKYRQLLYKEMDFHYLVRKRDLLIEDMKRSPLRLFHWILKRKFLNFSIMRILWYYHIALVK